MLMAFIAAAAIVGATPHVRGDFDHDGKIDVAELVRAGKGYELVIRTGETPSRTFLLTRVAKADVDNFFLAKAAHGRWRTWCGKGGNDGTVGPCHRTTVAIHNDTLSFGYREATESVVIWTGKQFEIVLLSD